MATIQEGLKSYIETNVTSAGYGFPLEIPQGEAFPAWSYRVVDDDVLLSHAGRAGFCKARIQLDVMAKEANSKSDYENSLTVANALRAALDGYKGAMGSATVYYCHTTANDDYSDIFELPYVSIDVVIHYSKS